MTDATTPRRKLGVWSLGFLWQPQLRRALADAGWRTSPFLGDAIGVWGRRGVARRGHAAARLTGTPIVTIEDGFLRSIEPGGRGPTLSLILDDLGVYYDSGAPSRLERLITDGGGDLSRAQRGIARLRRDRLSKYNHAPDAADPPKDHVLVIDQTRGDASITWGGADERAFTRMVDAARADHPGAEIIIKAHPDTVRGRKAGHFQNLAAADLRLWTDPVNPWDLIEDARAVYTVTSQLGFEALIAGKPVRCFGAPFYAGWGATEDEIAVPRRAALRTAEELFAAAYLEYPVYFDPWRGGVTDFETACGALATLKSANDGARTPAVCSGVRLWKRKYVAGFLNGAGGPPRFAASAQAAQALADETGARHVAWGSTATGPGVTRMEDGFLRSSGLGAALTPPLSLTLDDLGMYYDPTAPSRLEQLIAAAPETDQARQRALALAARITALGVTKYNTGAADIVRPDHPRVILAPGQVEDDASLTSGAPLVRTNLNLLQAIRRDAPDAHVIYKPHPDVEAGLRPGRVDPAELDVLVDQVATGISADAALGVVDEVWTMTSSIGFEALLRGRAVTCYGAPFYAGWGHTSDRGEIPERRRARPSLAALIHAILIDYPLYRDPVSGLPCDAELIVERLAAGAGRAGPGGRMLSKAQGALASYAWLWR